MDSLKKLNKGIRNPELAFWVGFSWTNRRLFGRNDPPIPDCDWDNLLLLDACRYDLFAENNSLPGDLQSRYSIASNTAEYVNKTYKGKMFEDIVLVTSTPKYYKADVSDNFHDVTNVWTDNWDEELNTVLPKVMNEHVMEASEKYPNKRILAHYIPPHVPFIGETGRGIPHKAIFSGGLAGGEESNPSIWKSLAEGELQKEEVWSAYRENLQLILPEIKKMLMRLPGKTVVTSDHGNAFGEFMVYGHPPRHHIKPLIKVPWLEHQNGSRKNIVKERMRPGSEKIDSEVVSQRLEDLGYI